MNILGLPGNSADKKSACNAGDPGSILGLNDFLEKDMATQSSILTWRIPMDRGVWWARVHVVAKSHRVKTGLSNNTLTFFICKYLFLNSVLFHWPVCLSLCQYHTAFITVTL